MRNLFLTFGIICLISTYLFAQNPPLPTSSYGKGIEFLANDSSFSTKIGFRFQTLYVGVLNTSSNQYADRLSVRRSRLKFDGFVLDPKFVYKVELAVSNQDQISWLTPEGGNAASIVLDAVLKWKISPNTTIWFGQTKLPGNRERVISSQKLQFVDRSLVNSFYNLDRGSGIQIHRSNKLNGMVINQQFALTMGEGRNVIANNPNHGYEYTARLEFLPFGKFTSDGDYFGSDLKREPKPKLSVGLTYDWNQHAARSRGNLGNFLTDNNGQYLDNNLSTGFADLMFKYNGFSVMSEFAYRSSSATLPGYGTGWGIANQVGYLFDNNFEVATRHTIIDGFANSSIGDIQELTLGISKYLSEHNLKFQSDISYQDRVNGTTTIQFRFQTEVAF